MSFYRHTRKPAGASELIDRTFGFLLSVDDVPEATLHPLPAFSHFWNSLRDWTLLIRKCAECKTLFSPARVCCPLCLSTNLGWKKSEGKGTIYSFSTVYVAFDDELNRIYCKNRLPYVLALVKLKENVFMTTNIVGCEPSEVAIGMQVKLM